MPQSLSAVYIHLAFSTIHRRPLLRDADQRGALHAYLGSISKNLDCQPNLVGGTADHIHILSRFGRTISQAKWVKELKKHSRSCCYAWRVSASRWRASFSKPCSRRGNFPVSAPNRGIACATATSKSTIPLTSCTLTNSAAIRARGPLLW